MFEKVEHLTRKCNKFGIMGSGTGRNEMMSRATIETVADTFMEYILYVSAKNVRAASLIDGALESTLAYPNCHPLPTTCTLPIYG